MPGMSEEKWEEFYEESSSAFYLHKLTLTEGHHFMKTLQRLFKQNNEVNLNNFMKELNNSKEEMNKAFTVAIKKLKSNIHNLPAVEKSIDGFMTNNKLRKNVSKCLFSTKIFKFMALNIERGDNTAEEQEEFLNKLKSALIDRYYDSREKSEDERVNSIINAVRHFREECKFLNTKNNFEERIQRFVIQFKIGFKNLEDLTKLTKEKYFKVEEFLVDKLKIELNKNLRKDNEFETNFMEKAKDLFGLRLSVDKYLNRLGGKLQKLEEGIEKLLRKLNKVNVLKDMLKNISKAKNKKEELNMLYEIEAYGNNEKNLNFEQFKEKIQYLYENWGMFYDAIEEENEKIKNIFKGSELLFIAYSLAKQFTLMFNEDGKPKIRVFKATESYMSEHAGMIGNVLGKRSVDVDVYVNIAEKIKMEIVEKCKNITVDDEEDKTELILNCKNYAETLLNDWMGYVSIDRNNAIFERPEEWALVFVDPIDEDGFRLADDTFMVVDMKKMPGMDLESGEWAELYTGALEHFDEHKFTLTETHCLFNVFLGEKMKKYLIKQEKMKEDNKFLSMLKELISDELKKSYAYQNEKNLKINTNSIKVTKADIQHCSLAVYLLKFTILHFDKTEKTFEEETEFLKNLGKKLNNLNQKIEKEDNEMDKKAKFIRMVVDNFDNFCSYRELEKTENKGNFKDHINELFNKNLNLEKFIKGAYEAVNQFEQKLNILSDNIKKEEFLLLMSELKNPSQLFSNISSTEQTDRNVRVLFVKLTGTYKIMLMFGIIRLLKIPILKIGILIMLKPNETINPKGPRANYIAKILQKLAFSVKNWRKQQKINKLEENTINKIQIIDSNPLNRTAILNILYCSSMKLDKLINVEGKIDMEELLKNQTNINVLEYAAKLNKVLGNYRFDKIHYKKIPEMIKEELKAHCDNARDEYCTKTTIEDLEKNWKNYCYLDKQNTEYEQPLSWKLNYVDSLQPDGFHLATFEMIGSKDLKNVPKILSNRLTEFMDNLIKLNPLHKMTYTETHHLITAINNVIEEENETLHSALNKIKIFELLENEIDEKKKENVKKLDDNETTLENEDDEKSPLLKKDTEKNASKYNYIEKNIWLKLSFKKCYQIVFAFEYLLNFYVHSIKPNETKMPRDELKIVENCNIVTKTFDDYENSESKATEIFTKLNEKYINFIDVIKSENKETLKKVNLFAKELEKVINNWDNLIEIDLFNENFINRTKNEFRYVLFEKAKFLVLNFLTILTSESNYEKQNSNIKEFPLQELIELTKVNLKVEEEGKAIKTITHTTEIEVDKQVQHKGNNALMSNDQKLVEKFSKFGVHFVQYCLAKRFLEAFNHDGHVRMASFTENEDKQNYGLKLYEMMERKVLDPKLKNFKGTFGRIHYSKIKNEMETQLYNECKNSKENNENCVAFLEEILQKWHGFCSIDTDKLEFERFEEFTTNIN
ncbi:hypothetical protein Mgra_00008615 [Meloidogyne graminicola]|uniref:Uncharacterized protein n=1 Tax=Meloidogyne graminicola TaxID=189291 RepID=A0A8S9ZFE5_9BILA|nr:hypothetical protein Mgra_00008615 [Meloidogyne graminicola]